MHVIPLLNPEEMDGALFYLDRGGRQNRKTDTEEQKRVAKI